MYASQLCNDDPDTLPGTAPQHKQLIQATYRALTAAGRGKKAHNREHARKLAAKRSEVLDFLQVRICVSTTRLWLGRESPERV